MSRKDKAILGAACALVIGSTGLMAAGAGWNPWLVMPGTGLYILAVLALCQFLGFNDRWTK